VLDTCHDKVELAPFISQLVEGLKDPSYDIKMLAHLMVIRLAAVAGAAMLESLDLLVEPLRTTVTFKPPQTAVKQDVDRNDELVRSALRSVVAIARIDNVESNMKFEEFLRTTVKTGELAEKFETIRIAENADNGDPMDTN
jgi:cullin-associated NEDD8-dissociated protein 1